MLKILINGQDQVIQCDDYYVRQLANGLDEVIFNVSIYDPLYPYITEEAKVTDIDGQTYLVKQIDAGKNDAKVICQLDLNDWKSTMYVAWGNGIKNLITTMRMITPSGWTIVNRSTSTELLSVGGSLTALDICAEICDTYDVYIRWNNYTKTVTVLDKVLQPSVGAFVTRELNMTELNYKGKSNGIITRLYAYGEDDLSFKSINGGKPYVDDFRYTSEVICGYWKDERYKYPETLMAAARKKLAGMCVPERSYSCSVVDLKATDPDRYGFLDFSMFTTATLIDDIKGFSMDYQVVERHTYPYYPEKNEVIFDSAPLRITRELNNTKELLSQKTDASQVQTEIDRATGVLQTGKSGYVVIGRNSDGYANEIYFLDQPSLDDARKVLRINRAGIGFSSNGVGGPYYQAWTMDGHFSLGGVNNAFGDFTILDGSGNPLGEWDKDGLKFYDSAQHILMLLNHTGLFLRDANGNTVAQMTADGLNIYKGTISGVTIDIARGNNIGLYCDGSRFQFGDFEVNDDYGRQILESTDEMTGMGGEPDDDGGLYFWAGYHDDDDYRFVVNEAGAYTMYNGTPYNIGETLHYILTNCCSGGGGCPTDDGGSSCESCDGFNPDDTCDFCDTYDDGQIVCDIECPCNSGEEGCSSCDGESGCSSCDGESQCGPGDGL